MRGLVVDSPGIDEILSGRKTWEIRGTVATVRGPVALIHQARGLIVGTCVMRDCLGPLSDAQLARTVELHRGPPDVRRSRGLRSAYAWVLEHARPVEPPVRCTPLPEAAEWVDLSGSLAAWQVQERDRIGLARPRGGEGAWARR